MTIKSDLTARRNFQTAYPALILLFLIGLVVSNSGCAGVTSAGAPASPAASPAITTATLPAGTLQLAYNAALSATGGTTPYSWRLTSGQLPAGLGLSPSGAVTGMPTQVGTSLFSVTVKDSSSPPQTAAGSMSISVSSGSSQVQITTISLASGQVGSAYSIVIAASGGTTPYSWSLTGGTLPTGLGLGASSGQISGTPTQSGTFPITVQVKDSSSPAQTASQGFSIVVGAAGTQVSITTSSVPNGQVGVAYSTTLAANGGTAPYTWSISAGALSPGLSLGAGNGVISGTPTASGSFSFTAKVTDSTSPTKQTATKSFTLTIASAGSTPVTITTPSVPNGQVGAAYSSTLTANGGIAPYAWSISAGALPAGLALGAGNGIISGTPTASGSFSFTAKMTDSTLPTKETALKSLSVTIAPAVQPGTSSLWQLVPTDVGWQWVSPTNSIEYKYFAASVVSDDYINRAGQFPTLVPAKYATWNDWANAQNARLQSWGFNAVGQYSGRFIGGSHPANGLPEAHVFTQSFEATKDSGFYHIKTLNHNYNGMVCPPTYVPSTGGQIDAYDPGLATAYMVLQAGARPFLHSWTQLIITEEADDLFGLNNITTHEDLGFTVVNLNPRQDRSGQGGFLYSDHAVYAKLSLRDFLANRYGCSGSADPVDPSYCGAGSAATALEAFNTAWETNYTTWNTSDSDGINGIKSGTYASYGTGTGLLDENGTHTLSPFTKSNCGKILPNDSWAANTTIVTDMHLFVAAFAATYGQKMHAGWAQSSIQPLPPVFEPLYDGPAYVYAALNPYFDGFWVTGNLSRIAAAASIPGGKSMPLIWADYSTANPDSSFAGSSGGGTLYPSQPAKGTGIVALWQSALATVDSNGKYVVVGFEHWPYYDQANEGWDGGLVTSDGDNPYDGSASIAVATHNTVWQASRTYAAPSMIWDGANYQHTSGDQIGNCSSGSSTPTWATQNGATTSDGTCIWRNEGPTADAKREPGVGATATIPNKAYGDLITPIANFLLTNPHDPIVGSVPAP